MTHSPSNFTAFHKPTERSVTVAGRQVLYSTGKHSWTHEASGYAEAVQTALQWISRAPKAEEAA
jgi:hypothetical protein